MKNSEDIQLKTLNMIARVLIMLLFLSVTWQKCYAQEYNTQIIPYRIGNKWGYCNPDKKVIINPQFTDADLFEGALAQTRIDSYYCIINQKGKILVKSLRYSLVINGGECYIASEGFYKHQVFSKEGHPLTKVYYEIGKFNEYGYAVVSENSEEDGLMNQAYQIVVPPVYSYIQFFSKELVKVYEPSRKGYALLNLATNHVTDSVYDKIYPPHEDLMMVVKGQYCGFINMTGKIVIPVTLIKAAPDGISYGEQYNESNYSGFHLDGFYDGRAAVIDGETPIYINTSGKTAMRIKQQKVFVQCDKQYGFSKGRAWVKSDEGLWGITDRHGKLILEPKYKSPSFLSSKELLVLDGFHEGLVAVAEDSLYGYVDTTGKLVIPYKYRAAEPFYDGMAAVYYHGKYGFVNRTGEMVIEAKYKYVQYAAYALAHPFEDGCEAAQEQDGKWIVINKQGKQIVPIKFEADYDIRFQYGVAHAKANGKRYVFNNKGDILYTFDTDGPVQQWMPGLFYSFDENCYINIKTKIKYLD